jgi:hypothetical protein
MMINIPAFAGEVFIFILLADFLLLALLWIAFGGIFTFGRDLTGRPLEISLFRKLISTVGLLIVLAYLALQIVLFARFLPYWTQDGDIGHEQISAMSVAHDSTGATVSYWVTTQTHRFGVSAEIYANLWVGEHVVFRYRPSDDGLFSIGLDPGFPYATPALKTPTLSPSPTTRPNAAPASTTKGP